jgi:hypothetical protein
LPRRGGFLAPRGASSAYTPGTQGRLFFGLDDLVPPGSPCPCRPRRRTGHRAPAAHGACWCRPDSSPRSARRLQAYGADRPATCGSSTRWSAVSRARGTAISTFPTEVMLVTSRKTRRWIIPKGWPQKGKAPHHSAALFEPNRCVIPMPHSRIFESESHFRAH